MSTTIDLYLVIDFEATCEQVKSTQWPQEIIEFPTVVVDAKEKKITSQFHQYVRPTHRPTLSEFCTELTGITQETVNNAKVFKEVFEEYNNWLIEIGVSGPNATKNAIFVTCGDWDLKTMLPSQLRLDDLNVPDFFTKWVNIKKIFETNTGQRSSGMLGMLDYWRLQLVGRHHSGIDDCKNIAQILIKMLDLGYEVERTFAPEGVCRNCGSEEHFVRDCPNVQEKEDPRMKPGDWICSCGVLNFARRRECYRCKKSQGGDRDNYGGRRDNYGGGNRNYGGGRDRDRDNNYDPRMKPGDWVCRCGELNFARRRECYRCNRPGGDDNYGGGNRNYGGGRDNGGPRMKTGDWICSCGELNFARRNVCYSCNNSKYTADNN